MWKPSRPSVSAQLASDHTDSQQHQRLRESHHESTVASSVSSFHHRCCLLPASASSVSHLARRTRSAACHCFSTFKHFCGTRVAALLHVSKLKALSLQHPCEYDNDCSLPIVCSLKANAVSQSLLPVFCDDCDCRVYAKSPPRLSTQCATSSPAVLLIEQGQRQSLVWEEYYSSRMSWEAELVARGDIDTRDSHLWSELLNAYPRFSLQDLEIATVNFSEKNVLGEGSSGTVYRGRLSSGLMVAVKVLRLGVKDAERGFLTELEILRYVQHRHILPLLGYCAEDRRLILVYSYLRRGSLESWLHGPGKRVLSWSARCKVAFGVARALQYLHTGCKRSVIHRDVKTSNILLSIDYSPKLSDFGLALWAPPSFVTCTDIMGTFGYLAPEYFQYGRVSTKMDVYSFGIVLLELMTGRRPIEREVPCGEENLATWARRLICSGSGTDKLADPRLRGLYSASRMRRILCTAALCVHPVDSKRPSSSTVLSLLRREKDGSISKLLLEAYAAFPSPILDVTLANGRQQKIHANNGEQRRRFLEMALADWEDSFDEKSALLDGPCKL